MGELDETGTGELVPWLCQCLRTTKEIPPTTGSPQEVYRQKKAIPGREAKQITVLYHANYVSILQRAGGLKHVLMAKSDEV